LRGVLDLDAHRGKFIANAIGFGKVLAFTRCFTPLDQRLDLRSFITADLRIG